MGFEKASNFLLIAAQKYRFRPQAMASLTCERVRKIFVEHYPKFTDMWEPQKFEQGVLVICTKNSAAASELFLQTHELMEIFAKHDFPEKIEEIRIVRGDCNE